MSAVDLLREAADTVEREATDTQDACGEERWSSGETGWNDVQGLTHTVNGAVRVCEADCEEPAVYIARMDPLVGLAVAAWLRREADLHEAVTATGRLLVQASKSLGELRLVVDPSNGGVAASTMPQAVAVARAILRRPA